MSIRSKAIVLSLVLSLSAPDLAAAADDIIYRCRDSAGVLSFSDYPCPAGSSSEGTQAVQSKPAAAAGTAGIAPQCAAAGGNLNHGRLGEEFRAGLPPAQRSALDLALEALANEGAQDYRWRRSARADLHLCARSRRGEPIEAVAAELGQVVLFRRGVGQYLNDPETPDALRERCSTLVTSCYVPSETSIDSCVHQSRICSSVPPWTESEACCPQACKDAYASRRGAGEEPLKAFLAALHEAPGCIPGTSLVR